MQSVSDISLKMYSPESRKLKQVGFIINKVFDKKSSMVFLSNIFSGIKTS